jgi:hypothetical protein
MSEVMSRKMGAIAGGLTIGNSARNEKAAKLTNSLNKVTS